MKNLENQRLSRNVFVAVLAVVLAPVASAKAAIVFSEDWSTTTTTGTPVVTGAEYSQLGPGKYYLPVTLPVGWSQTGQVGAWSTGASTTISGILLNESPDGMVLNAAVTGLTAGSPYLLSFNYWGDNRPTDLWASSLPYGVKYSIDGNTPPEVNGTWAYSPGGYTIPNTETYTFTASASTVTLSFGAHTPSGSELSPILGAVTIESAFGPSVGVVPEPSSHVVWSLVGAVGIAVNRRRRKPLA